MRSGGVRTSLHRRLRPCESVLRARNAGEDAKTRFENNKSAAASRIPGLHFSYRKGRRSDTAHSRMHEFQHRLARKIRNCQTFFANYFRPCPFASNPASRPPAHPDSPVRPPLVAMSLTKTETQNGRVVLTRDEITPPLTRAPSPVPRLLVAPLVPSSTLYDTDELTPAIGIKVRLQLKGILALPQTDRDTVIRDLAISSEFSRFFFVPRASVSAALIADAIVPPPATTRRSTFVRWSCITTLQVAARGNLGDKGKSRKCILLTKLLSFHARSRLLPRAGVPHLRGLGRARTLAAQTIWLARRLDSAHSPDARAGRERAARRSDFECRRRRTTDQFLGGEEHPCFVRLAYRRLV